MTRFGARASVLFALAATIPVALTTIVWLGVAGMGQDVTGSEAALARTRLHELEAQRADAVDRLCRDDLAVDTMLRERAEEADPAVDYDRLFHGTMQAAGLDALWVIDGPSGAVLARGHQLDPLGESGVELERLAREAGERPFFVKLGSGDDRQFVLQSCSISRGGARLAIVAGHSLSKLRALDPEQILVTDATHDDEIALLELSDSSGIVQGVVVWRSGIDRSAPPLLLWMACVAALALGLALLFGGHLNRWLQSSVDELTAAATRVGRGDFDTTLRDDGAGAFPATATAFNRMTRDLRDARAQLRQTERVAAWQEIAKSLAHELKNPLSPIRLSIETLRKAHERSHEDFDALFDESTRAILQEVDRLRAIVDEFSRFARLPSPRVQQTDLCEALSQAASLHAEGSAVVSVELPASAVEARVDPDQLMQVLHNLLQNARDAASEAHPSGGGRVVVSLGKDARSVWIRVEDNGGGIPEARRDSIFDPYFTTKEGGSGLGLAISQRIVAEHGGRIEVESRPGKTVFIVFLPAEI